MSEGKQFWCKITILSIVGILSTSLFFLSLGGSYQSGLAREHIRFRSGFPSQENWITSPLGTLYCYLFNVTNSEAFLNGTDSKLNLQEIGPIVYRIKGRNDIISQTHSTLTFQKNRYKDIEFDAEASCAPDILNQTIILPNFILLSAAAKLHDWVFLVRHAFNAITINESVFLNNSIYYFLWEFTTPVLSLYSNYVPNIVSNCGVLYNSLQNKAEMYSVKIGTENGFSNFFRINTLNNNTYFPEQSKRLRYKDKYNDHCPIEVTDAFDNSLFPPLLKTADKLRIVAGESCRTFELKYIKSKSHVGFNGYKYVFDDMQNTPNCLNTSMGIPLPNGMFDAAPCLFNDVPAAFAAPHFYGSSYNWSEHYTGLSPDKERHETMIVIEPTTGIPLEEKYRFQSNIPMPDMKGYSKGLQRFSHMVVPTIWYEYKLDDYPEEVMILLRLNVFGIPVIQPIFVGLFAILAIYCFLNIFLILKDKKIRDIIKEIYV